MPRRPLLAALVTTLAMLVLTAACTSGGGSPIDEAIFQDATTTTLGFEPGPDSTVAPRPPRPKTCDALEEAALRVGTAVQLLAQLRSVDQYNLIKQGAATFDAAQVLADLDDLRALQRTEVPEDLGTVRAAIDTYVRVTRLARDNLQAEDPFAEGGKGPDLVALTQDVRGFLKGQVTIGVALDTLGCS